MNSTTVQTLFVFIAVFTISMVFLGCTDEPSPVGLSLLLPQDFLQIDSLTIVADESFTEKAIPGLIMEPFTGLLASLPSTKSTFAVGKINNFESWALLQFAGFPDTLGDATLVGAEMRLRSRYHLGDTGPLSFKIHRALGTWNRRTFVYDSLKAPGFYELSGMDHVAGSVSDTEEVLVPIDTVLVRSWLKAVVDTTVKNFGIVLEPTNGTVIKGFAGNETSNPLEHRPVLIIRFIRAGSIQIDTLTFSSVDKFVVGSTDLTFLQSSSLVYPTAGASYRGVLGFDVSSIPARALIHRAYLKVTPDSLASQIASNQPDSLLAIFTYTRTPVQVTEKINESGRTVYRMNVTEFVEEMVRGGGDRRIRLAVYGEDNTVGRFAIHGSTSATPSFRPQLEVLFSATQ